MRRLLVVLVVSLGVLAVGAAPAGATRECEGLMVCVPRVGPWVVVPTGGGVPRPQVSYQLTCPKAHVVGGLDAELSARAIDVDFRGLLGSPVNPGITTARSVVYPLPPWTWMPSLVTRSAISVAKSFAIAASISIGSPASQSCAAWYMSARAASTCVAMSASLKRIAWKSAMAWPNWTRS